MKTSRWVCEGTGARRASRRMRCLVWLGALFVVGSLGVGELGAEWKPQAPLSVRIERTRAALQRTSTLLVGPYQWESYAVLCHQLEDLLVLAQKPTEGQAYLAHCQEVLEEASRGELPGATAPQFGLARFWEIGAHTARRRQEHQKVSSQEERSDRAYGVFFQSMETRLQGAQSPDYGAYQHYQSACLRVAELWTSRKQQARAVQRLERCLRVTTKSAGQNLAAVAPMEAAFAGWHQQHGNTQESCALYKQAERHFQTLGGAHHSYDKAAAPVLAALQRCAQDNNKLAEAAAYQKRLEDNLARAAHLKHVEELYQEARREQPWPDTERKMRALLEVLEAAPWDTPVWERNIRTFLAAELLAQGRLEEASREVEAATRVDAGLPARALPLEGTGAHQANARAYLRLLTGRVHMMHKRPGAALRAFHEARAPCEGSPWALCAEVDQWIRRAQRTEPRQTP